MLRRLLPAVACLALAPAAIIAAQAALPLPTPPTVAQPLFQETGIRPSRA